MKDPRETNNPFDDQKVIDACSIFGMMDQTGRRFSGEDVIKAISNMHDRSNGLGGGFAVYGLYPEHHDCYAFHIMYLDREAKRRVESFLEDNFSLVYDEEVPTSETATVKNPPLIWRYFVQTDCQVGSDPVAREYVLDKVMKINTSGKVFVLSSGKNMGVFKGVGYPEDIAKYFCLKEYRGYLWVAHGRFPTNSQAWWGGAHPFNILDWTVVHNGELSSYGTNRRYLETCGYQCTLQTDTEVFAYAVDLLMRRHGLPIEAVSKIFAPPFWTQIDRMPPEEKYLYKALRQVYGSLLMNGPFTVIIAHEGEMIGLTDRIKLRPLIAGRKGGVLYLSSEEAAIRLVCSHLDEVRSPRGGEPVVGRLMKDEKQYEKLVMRK